MGGLLVAAHELGYELRLLWLTDGSGSSSSAANARSTEARSVASALHAVPTFLGFDDGHVEHADLIPTIETELSKVEPEIVVWPFSDSDHHHQDHIALHRALMNIAKRARYGSCSWLAAQPVVYDDHAFAPSLYHSFDEPQMSRVVNLMALYASEENPPLGSKGFSEPASLQVRRQRWAQEGQTGTPFAEAYQLVKGRPPSQLFETNDVTIRRFAGEFPSAAAELNELESACRARLVGRLVQVILDGDEVLEPTTHRNLLHLAVACADGSRAVAFVEATRMRLYEVVHVALVRNEDDMVQSTSEASRRLRVQNRR